MAFSERTNTQYHDYVFKPGLDLDWRLAKHNESLSIAVPPDAHNNKLESIKYNNDEEATITRIAESSDLLSL